MTPGPDYYRLADGRQFYEYSRDELVPMCKGLDPWDVHCIISAAEHLFRMGAKEGEMETDIQSYRWWTGRMDATIPGYNIWMKVFAVIFEERTKVGR